MNNRFNASGHINNIYISLIYKCIFILICGYGLLLHISPSDMDYNIKMFSYFTVISNTFCLLISAIYIIKALKNYHILSYSSNKYYAKIYTSNYSLFTGTSLMAIILTFLIYHFMVAKYKYPLLHNNMLHLPTKDLLAHYIVPFMFILDWLLFQPKNINNIKSPIRWMWYPLLYLGMIMFRAFFLPRNSALYLKSFPYFFLDIAEIGTRKFLIYVILIIFMVIVIGYSILAIEKLIHRLSFKR